jgi:hypothetical protein
VKYKSQKVRYDHHSFSSKLEAALYQWLKLREQNKEIEDIRCQETIYLTDARIIYKPDFSYLDMASSERRYAEAKGYETSDWRIKRRLWMYYGPGILEIYKGSHNNFSLQETLKPPINF